MSADTDRFIVSGLYVNKKNTVVMASQGCQDPVAEFKIKGLFNKREQPKIVSRHQKLTDTRNDHWRVLTRGEASGWRHRAYWLDAEKQSNHPAPETKGESVKKPANLGRMSCRCARWPVLQGIAPPLGAHSAWQGKRCQSQHGSTKFRTTTTVLFLQQLWCLFFFSR